MSKKSILDSRYLKFLNHASENTIKSYSTSIKRYEDFHGMTLDELIDEALDEQTRQVPQHLLKIIDRLESYQEFLISEGLVVGTIRNGVTRIKTIYKRNRVVIPYIEPINTKVVKKRPTIEFSDLLTKDELRQALPLMRLNIRSKALTMIQSGLSNEECEHLTTRQFIDELYKYHQCDNDEDALQWLADENHPVIWVSRQVRVKTGKPFYALIGAEAVNCIASAKLYEQTLPKNKGQIPAKLFDTHKLSINRVCSEINRRLGFGKAGDSYRLRPHMMRKFHATHIKGSALTYEEEYVLSYSEVDEMQGRGKTSVQDTYMKSNPLEQKLLYAKVMNNVSLHHQYDYDIVDGDVVVYLRNPYTENMRLKKEIEKISQKLQEKNEGREKINALKDELGEDAFIELVQGILNVS